MNAIKKYQYEIILWIGCIVIQLALIWWLYPSPSQFSTVQTYTGVYMDEHKTNSCIGGYPITGGHCLSCGASFVGNQVVCGHRELNSKTVTAEVARYRTLFGESETVVRLSSSGLAYIDYSKERLVKLWIDDSILDAIRNAVFLTLAFSLFRQWILLRKGKSIPI